MFEPFSANQGEITGSEEKKGWGKSLEKREEREQERDPCCFSNQEVSSSSLGDLFAFFFSSFMPQFSTAPPSVPFIHFFCPSSSSGQLTAAFWKWRHKRIQAGGVVKMTHLRSCITSPFSSSRGNMKHLFTLKAAVMCHPAGCHQPRLALLKITLHNEC